MKKFNITLAASLLAVLGTASVHAQTMQKVGGPAERPPASYQGKQFVDSRGCIFVRSGFGGNVTWVPRVSRGRKVLCGAKPSNVAGSEKVDPAGTRDRPAPAAVARPAPAPRPAPTPQPAPRVIVRQPAPAVVVPQPAPTVVAPAPAVRRVVPQAPAGKPACNYGQGSDQYVNSGSGYPVRCGPQPTHPADASRVLGSGGGVNRAPSSNLKIMTPRPVTTPSGYRGAWKDGRLNPKRGVGKLSGAVETSLVWTRTVPRRLLDARTGRDVTTLYGYLEYPYTNYAEQKRSLLARGAPIGGVTVRSAPQVVTRGSSKGSVQKTRAGAANTRASTKSQAAAQIAPMVHVGLFAGKPVVRQTVRRLQGMGLSVRLGETTRDGRKITVISTGPFASADAAGQALRRVKLAGYSYARLR